MGNTAVEAYETYLNGNITDFKKWMRHASKSQIMTITYLWLKDGNSLIKLRAYLLNK